MLDRQRRHVRKDGGRQIGEERVHKRSISARAASGLRSFAPEMKKM
jgi:hypothetical protein